MKHAACRVLCLKLVKIPSHTFKSSEIILAILKPSVAEIYRTEPIRSPDRDRSSTNPAISFMPRYQPWMASLPGKHTHLSVAQMPDKHNTMHSLRVAGSTLEHERCAQDPVYTDTKIFRWWIQ